MKGQGAEGEQPWPFSAGGRNRTYAPECPTGFSAPELGRRSTTELHRQLGRDGERFAHQPAAPRSPRFMDPPASKEQARTTGPARHPRPRRGCLPPG